MFGDLTPLSAKVSGYVETVAVNDFQSVRKGDLIVRIEPSDYLAALEQAEAGLAAAQAVLANLGNRKDIQRPRSSARPKRPFSRRPRTSNDIRSKRSVSATS
jgi:multidrug resistance efflux pump